ncbi:MAG: diguanylate cyclase (GGDEF)-like protein/PAS domain S-box-containing protein [Sulfurimonas sp.]|jgi:diguanylate cyclase (GGDEF)-like protein/PAS domain S-box-containing protein|uniref:bifunctional diguanylate cyclase/phosphodiesterase n=1 Tax=Sulfurimonas sp. TaxID=2022749 RepID=UPI0039E28E3E
MSNKDDTKSQLLSTIENQQFLLKQKTKIIDEHVFMTVSDPYGKIIDISQAYLNFTGYKREDVIGKNHKVFRTSEIDKEVIKNLWETILQNKVWTGELKNNKITGAEYWIKTIIEPIYDVDNNKIGYISIKEDITTNKRLEELSSQDQLTLLHNKRHFDYYIKKELNRSKSTKEKIAISIIEIDDFPSYKDKYGHNTSHKLLLHLSKVLKKHIKPNLNIQEIFKTSESEFSVIILNQDDKYIQKFTQGILELFRKMKDTKRDLYNSLSCSIGTVNLDTTQYTLTCNDLYNIADANLSAARKAGGDQIVSNFNKEYVANLKNIDNITKLPNRNTLLYDLSILKNEAMLIILHINQLNSLQELYGFAFTSNILIAKSINLQDILNDQESNLYTLNLQEFAILITEKKLFEKYLLLLKHSILAPIDACSNIKEDCIQTDFTAGVSYGVQKIFNQADLILQEAILSKISYKVYQNNQSAKQLQLDNLSKLKIYKNALHTGNIIPYFQPIVKASDASLIKYEALARIRTDDGEIISPYYFLDAAKEDKTFENFTRQMMQKVFNIFAKNSVAISMNISYENINSESMVSYIKNRLEKYGGNGITFEILESEDILDYTIIETFITMVKTYGCKVSIDDFGSGYSNFTNLIKLDIDYLKLDGSLIQKLNTDDNIKHMIKGLLSYAKNANIETIAEFVSSEDLADTARELGIDYLQGYYYGEPKAPESWGLL